MTESQSESISDSPFNHSNERNDAIVPEIQIKIVSEEGMALLKAAIIYALTGFAEIKDAVAICKWVFKAPSCDVPCSRSSQSMPVAERWSVGTMENGMVENRDCSSESANENRDRYCFHEPVLKLGGKSPTISRVAAIATHDTGAKVELSESARAKVKASSD
ncbi:hypothetical protein C1H46_008382 [Malus baccata]|uniref:Uncharacterized protein n=1 Tax=Malus baccata TaxID=106549 RepID=A0A540N4H9_MALBA|nr:hypothetical protein C1H46_008382 [Malus baccata]